MLRVPIAGKRVKIFKKRTDEEPYVILDKTDNEEQSDKDRGEGGYQAMGTSEHTGGWAGSEGASVVV